jgi:ribosomal protein S18 acetylase RimI-like enzyme
MTIQDELRPNVIVRAIIKEDQIDSREIILSGLGEHFPEIDPSLNPDLDDIVTYYLESGHQFVVAITGDRIVGTGGLLIEKQKEGRIVRLSVIRELRGLGIGQAVVNELLQRAKNRHLLRINVETNLDWYPAIGLYRRCGFRELYTDDESVHMVLDIRP